MKIAYKGSLQRTMIIYFLLISFASVLIVTEFVLDIQSKSLRSQLAQNVERLAGHQIQPDEAFQPIQTLRNKAILMVALLLVVVLILLMMFIKNITEPLQHMIETSKLIAAGDLSRTVAVHAGNELAEMGSTVNDLTSNLQEMILLSRDMCTAAGQFTDHVADVLADGEMNPGRIDLLRREAQSLGSKTRFLNDIIIHCKFHGIAR